ncbi:hypothetical protein [Sporosarcina sp. HYO08]|uniref:hypothetical protein n=1 Tax=Sporosarcina sp. HYO08 TaxID=1759557 RepID=UPI000798A25F|nr:hypothetical protein [Sporosarcina sp. HYO08]KXH83807.1 hypothetical protein AU377_03320 [Sporosarcina sp. HYO08]
MSWIIGKSIERKDAYEKVTGAAKYTADFSSTDRLHVNLMEKIARFTFEIQIRFYMYCVKN